MSNLEESCFNKAAYLMGRGYVQNMDLFQLTDLLIKLEREKIEKDEKSDLSIEFNDEIESIEHVGELETIDISVSGDNLFYCNGILTKNSFGLPATADFMVALIVTEELDQLGQLMIKQLKNRYADLSMYRKFVVGLDRSKMRLYDVEDKGQLGTDNAVPANPSNDAERRKKLFQGFK